MSKRDDTSDVITLAAVGLLAWLLWPRGGARGGRRTGGVSRVAVQADTYVFGGASFADCDALASALPPGDVIVDGAHGTHEAVTDLVDCLERTGRRVHVL